MLRNACEILAQECILIFDGRKGNPVSEEWVGLQERGTENCDLELLDERLNYIRNRQEDQRAIQQAINDGLGVVVERFKAVKLMERVFNMLKLGAAQAGLDKHQQDSKSQVNFQFKHDE